MTHRTEHVATKAAGAAKLVKAAFKGFKGVFRTLTEEHGEAAALMKRIAISTNSDVYAEFFPQLRDALLAHERAELAVVYPVLAKYDETRAIAADHAEEARELERVLNELDGLPMDSLEWKPKFERLAAMVERHVSEEEGAWFATAQKAMGESKAEELQRAYLAKKHEVV